MSSKGRKGGKVKVSRTATGAFYYFSVVTIELQASKLANNVIIEMSSNMREGCIIFR